MTNVIVDFETYYDKEVSVVTQGLRNYVKSADAYIVAVVAPGFSYCGPVDRFGTEYVGSWVQDPEFQFWAANSNFDQAFWEKYFPKTARPWKCILDLAAFHQLPRALDGVCRVALKKSMDKSVRDEMKGVRFESLPPDKQQRVIEYCLNDAKVTAEILQALPPMSSVEDALAEHTRMINRRGIRVDVEKVRRDIRFLEELRFLNMKRIPWVDAGEAPLSYQQFAVFCESKGVGAPASLDKRDLACTAWMEAHPELATVVNSMRTFRGMNTKLEKLKSILAAADESNIVPLDLLYCGARHTRRWSSKSINVQNLDAKRVFVDEMKELPFFQEHPEETPGIYMREYFLPPNGMKFGIADYSQVEPRCLNWIVSNDPLLEALRAGFGLYEAHAKASMQWSGAPGTLKHTDPDRYRFAKCRVLGLGYGMGPDRFCDYAKTNGVHIDLDTAKAQVADFRRTNSKIVKLWRTMHELILHSQRQEDRTLELEMPTGDKLKHFAVRGLGRDKGFESYTIRGEFSQASHCPRLFGGLLTENITQRMARDILGEAILRLEKAGVPVIFHAHDEAIMALNASSAKSEFEEAKRLMAQCPEWCPDLPLAVDGDIHDHYVKLA